MRRRRVMPIVCVLLALAMGAQAAPQQANFSSEISTVSWPLAAFDAQLPADWSDAEFLVIEFRASASQGFDLGVVSDQGTVSRRIHPFAEVWVRASLPLRFYREDAGNAAELAGAVNQPRSAYWLSREAGGAAALKAVRAISITQRYPAHASRIEVRKVSLAKTDPGDAVLEAGAPLVDDFGQYRHVPWPGKATSLDALRREWAQENRMLPPKAGVPACRHGGFSPTAQEPRRKATGFFRVEQIAGRWWFVDPEGCRFWSAGVSGVDDLPATSIVNRSRLFASIPTAAQIPVAGAEVDPLRDPVSFYLANLRKRHGAEWQAPTAQVTARRMRAWGLNTVVGPVLNDRLTLPSMRQPYAVPLRGWQHLEGAVMGLPDVYAPAFAARVDREAAEQLAPRRNDPWMLGYFIGNEPAWPGRESQLVDRVLTGAATEMQRRFKSALASGDTPALRKSLVHAAFAKYLEVVNAATRRHDPNHLNLGIRFADMPTDDVIALARGFDVFSVQQYGWAPTRDSLSRCHAITRLPILVSGFHFGTPERGLAPGRAQVVSQSERGVAYSYFVENAAALPPVIGVLWRQWIDQPVTGSDDGENYNIGWIDVTDRPYPELVAAAKATHAKTGVIHAGSLAPTTRRPRASEFGTPDDAAQLRAALPDR